MATHCKDCQKVLPSLFHIEERCYSCHTEAVRKPLLEEIEQLHEQIKDLMVQKL